MYILHPWHGVSADFDVDLINGIVEIPRGRKSKYEIDKQSGLLKLDRVLAASFEYPINYGFIPQSLGDDGDPLDILVLSQIDIEPLCLVRSRIIGVMHMSDRGKMDDKIISVCISDPAVNEIGSIDSLPHYLKQELRHFFEQYTVLENKQVVVNEFSNANKAIEIVQQSLINYKTTFVDNK